MTERLPQPLDEAVMATARQTLEPRSPAGDIVPGSIGGNARRRLIGGLPLHERRLELAGISTAVLEGGDGPPIVLLHGPGESAANWRWIVPRLVKTHRVIAPDLPAHGDTGAPDDGLDANRVHDGWRG